MLAPRSNTPRSNPPSCNDESSVMTQQRNPITTPKRRKRLRASLILIGIAASLSCTIWKMQTAISMTLIERNMEVLSFLPAQSSLTERRIASIKEKLPSDDEQQLQRLSSSEQIQKRRQWYARRKHQEEQIKKNTDAVSRVYTRIVNHTDYVAQPSNNGGECNHRSPAVSSYDTCTASNYMTDILTTTSTTMSMSMENTTKIATVEYIACCGLGHRLARMSAAALVAKTVHAPFFGHWQCCNEILVFPYLFGNEPMILYDPSSIQNHTRMTTILPLSPPRLPQDKEYPVQRQSSSSAAAAAAAVQVVQKVPVRDLQFRNIVTGFTALKKSKGIQFNCSQQKMDSDFQFYTTLMERYHMKHVVDRFVQDHFRGRTVLGMHIRAGNNETGEFTKKRRNIKNQEAFVNKTVIQIESILTTLYNNGNDTSTTAKTSMDPPILFIATDSHEYVDAIRQRLQQSVGVGGGMMLPVVELSQSRPAQGQGVLFGTAENVVQSGNSCLTGWDYALQDMMILSHADILLIPTPSSFTQSMPVSVVSGRKKQRNMNPTNSNNNNMAQHPIFCELHNPMPQCYLSLQDWCLKTPLRKTSYFDIIPSWRDLF